MLGVEIKYFEFDVILECFEGDVFGWLIMLYDLDGFDVWDGIICLVVYV